MSDTNTDTTAAELTTAISIGDYDDWTLRPIEANRDTPRWPLSASEWDAAYRTELDGGWKRQQDDPRPNIGVSCGGHYLSDGREREHTRRFECTQCGLGKALSVGKRIEAYKQRRFACPACRDQTIHNPAGVKPPTLIPFDTSTSDP